ncbi:MAG: hypothetical protein ACI4GD_08975 [Lachnospiraceae bacterium]
MFNEKKAREIAEDFLSKMNPGNWNGMGEKPDEFNTLIRTYDIDSKNNNELDISFDYDNEEKCWLHYCELRNKTNEELMIPLHGYGVDSVQNLISKRGVKSTAFRRYGFSHLS